MSLQVTASLAPKIGFASHQNAVALLHDLSLTNPGPETLSHLTVRLTSAPRFLKAKQWKIDLLKPGASLRIVDRQVHLDASFLADLAESLHGEILLEVTHDDSPTPLCSTRYPVELLAKSHWGGTGSMPELLPAFCLPNDPAIDKILRAASAVLQRAAKDSAIDGYKSQSRARTWELTSALWSAVCGLRLAYAYPPASFETQGQKVRPPGAILEGRLATCLDSALLFAAALEQAHLNPLIILSQGHACVGVWLQPQEFPQTTTDEAAAIRKRVELQELLIFETTLASQSPPPTFSAAVASAKIQLTDAAFLLAIDIRRARLRQIKPLALPTPSPAPASAHPLPSDTLEEAPPLPSFDVAIAEEPSAAQDRISQWQRKLLDLTTRNRLLHLPESRKQIPLVCPDPAALEDLLSAGKIIRISPFPDLQTGGRDAALYQQQHLQELNQQYAREALHSNEVLSSLPAKKLEAELIDLYRTARTDMNEGGANTLFLALGFLHWKKSPTDARSYRAPLILLPVKLLRKNALVGVTMALHEDEPRFNLTLLELLRQDFDLAIPGLDGELPQDNSGIDVVGIWNRVRHAVKEIPAFEVSTDSAVGTFSFAKYLMWKDLTDRKEQLSAHPVVQQLLERGLEPSGADAPHLTESQLDALIAPSDLFTPLPADSSQIAAVVASAKTGSFVLDGPPGTGKSQTIANIIAHNLALGRRVLFVAEKMAALEVVHRRLAEKGLADFCLEVHSNKTSKTAILEQLDRAWSARDDLDPQEWISQTDRLRHLRDLLNTVCQRLHFRHPNDWTIHQAIGHVIRDHTSATPKLSWASGTPHSAADFAAMRETARRLDLNFSDFSDAPPHFSVIAHREWSHGWQETVLRTAKALPPAISALRSASEALQAHCQCRVPTDAPAALARLAQFARALLASYQKNLSFAFAPDFPEKVAAARQLVGALADYQTNESTLSVPYQPEAARAIDVDLLDAQWAAAQQKYWIFASMSQKKCARSLPLPPGRPALPDVAQDLPRLRRMKHALGILDQLQPLVADIPGCAALHSQPDLIAETLETAQNLLHLLPTFSSSPDALLALKTATRRLAVDANALLAPDGAIALALGHLEAALADFREHGARFAQLCAIPDSDSLSLDHIQAAAQAVAASEPRLRSWCTWQKVRQTAAQQNLTPLLEALEQGRLTPGSVEPTFLTAYAKWFAAEMIDREPVLRDLVAAEHMDRIADFRAVDEKVAELSAQYIRTKLCERLPAKSDVSRKDGYGILKHELQKKRSHKPLRQLASEMGPAFSHLAPCMLMSPLSIAQYLPADQPLFDLVIFDEASQITPWDAVGSIARGKQVVIAGDPRQMPPTHFFQRGPGDGDSDGELADDLESILDECLAVGVPRRSLNWHYRSRHESLIAFSNYTYYGNHLITFPAAVTRESAVIWRRVSGVYAKGRGQTNQVEAEAVVAETVKRLTDPQFIQSKHTLAIITLNSHQQELIEDLLDMARRAHPEIEPYFNEELSEPVVVKNLETVQGDERDVILLSIGFGPTTLGAGTMSMNLGPLNRDGGERRLNVALTRAKHEMLVFTSFDPSFIDLNRTSARAVRDLKHFLEFADRGPRALAEAVQGSVGGFDSPFEEAVARRLQDQGWQVITQIGVSRFRIDLGIVHPDRPGDFLVGIECDGATYHRSATARDRDKVRAAVLEGLGWTLLRVWSTDWFVDPERELARLHTHLETLLKTHRETSPLAPESPADAPADLPLALVASQVSNDPLPPAEPLPPKTFAIHFAHIDSPTPGPAPYQTVDFADLAHLIKPDDFYEESYDAVLLELMRLTLRSEAPLADDLLVQRIARAHDFKRAGNRIRDRILTLVDGHFHLRQDALGGGFVWLHETGAGSIGHFRIPAQEANARSIEEIPCEEIQAAFAHFRGSSALDVARTFGIKRLTSPSRERIERARELLQPRANPAAPSP